jgi:hypothetical protein
LPETSIALEPRVNFRKRLCSDLTGPPLGIAAASHKTSRFEDTDVLRDCARRHLERLGELSDRRLTV